MLYNINNLAPKGYEIVNYRRVIKEDIFLNYNEEKETWVSEGTSVNMYPVMKLKEPSHNSYFWFVDNDSVRTTCWSGSKSHISMLEQGNYFLTKELAEEAWTKRNKMFIKMGDKNEF